MSFGEEFSAVYSKYFPKNDEDDDFSSNSDDDGELYLTHSEDDMEKAFVKIDLSTVDEEEQELVTKFLSNNCCTNKCQTIVPRKMIESTRNNCLELSKNELDLLILSHIEAGMMCNEELESVYSNLAQRKKCGQRKDVEVRRHKIEFTFNNVPVCRLFFLFVHACGIRRYKNLVNHFRIRGATLRVHGLANKPSTNPKALKSADIQKAVKFIEYLTTDS